MANASRCPLGERVFVFDRDAGHAQELAVGAGYPLDPHIAPDVARVAFVRDSGDLVDRSAWARSGPHAS